MCLFLFSIFDQINAVLVSIKDIGLKKKKKKLTVLTPSVWCLYVD